MMQEATEMKEQREEEEVEEEGGLFIDCPEWEADTETTPEHSPHKNDPLSHQSNLYNQLLHLLPLLSLLPFQLYQNDRTNPQNPNCLQDHCPKSSSAKNMKEICYRGSTPSEGVISSVM